MKRFFVFAALLAIVVTGCNKTEMKVNSISQERLSFNAPLVNIPTRAAINGIVYPQGQKFRVFADFTEAEWTAGNTSQRYMNNVPCAYNPTLTGWEPVAENGTTPVPYFWPNNGYLHFQAYSPMDANTYFTSVEQSFTDGLKFKEYTIDETNMLDLLYSDINYNEVKASYEDGNDPDFDGRYFDPYKGIDIMFRHALSCIRVTARTDADYSSAVKLLSVGFRNIKYKGDFSETGVGEMTKSTPTWILTGDKAGYTPHNSELVLTETAQSLSANKDYILMPQILTTEGTTDQEIVISYTITSGENTIPQTQVVKLSDLTYTDADGVDVGKAWVAGKRYTYNIIIGLDRIYFDPGVEDWVDVNVGDIVL